MAPPRSAVLDSPVFDVFEGGGVGGIASAGETGCGSESTPSSDDAGGVSASGSDFVRLKLNFFKF